MRFSLLVLAALAAFIVAPAAHADVDPAIPSVVAAKIHPQIKTDERTRRYLTPTRVVWKSETGISREETLFDDVMMQTSTAEMNGGFHMEKTGKAPCAVLLDFGAEIHGGIRLEARDLNPAKGSVGKSVRLRVRFGESADEAMSEIGEKGSVNEHSTRDMIVNVPWLGAVEFGESAFRFVRLDLVDPGTKLCLDSVRATFVFREVPWLGSFRCSDERLNQIWETAVYTQLLTMQHYIFEGAKRDRLVWYGDINPQTMTTLNVFGAPEVLKETLGTYAEKTWPLPGYMNGMPNYSLWWLISVGDLYHYTGDREYLAARAPYLFRLYRTIKKQVRPSGQAGFPQEFLDWPTADNPKAQHAGTHAIFVIAVERVVEIADALGNEEVKADASALLAELRAFIPDNVGNKQAAALMALAGLEDPAKPNVAVVAKNGGENFSTFYGYYMLEALAVGERHQEALNIIREYWGAMLDVGATTFWEDFNLEWLRGAGRIDELTPEGKESLHGDRGAYCYEGFRHSLCHGWSSGPAPWLSRHILGVTPAKPGFAEVGFDPFLGDLDWAEGTIPTPNGVISVRVEKSSDGTVRKSITLPEGCICR
ncbi:MAG: alpha-L-rhamnosidase C-terminal domain-containing protein [Thermoguttaceae bacterium]|jgi:alpha-L-rhamnosidase